MERVTGYYEYETKQGDTFDALALQFYGDEFMSSKIIEFNPDYCDVLVFEPYVNLRIPEYEVDNTDQTLAPWYRGDGYTDETVD